MLVTLYDTSFQKRGAPGLMAWQMCWYLLWEQKQRAGVEGRRLCPRRVQEGPDTGAGERTKAQYSAFLGRRKRTAAGIASTTWPKQWG